MDSHDTVSTPARIPPAWLGEVPAARVRTTPSPGKATQADCISANELGDRPLCELIDGVLVEKAMGYEASVVAATIIRILGTFIASRQLGFVSGADGFFRLGTSTRGPDVAFLHRDRLPGGKFPREPYPRLVPNLVVEVLSPGNTPGEMARKRRDYFEHGVQLMWIVDCAARTVTVYSSPTDAVVRHANDSLDAGTVIPDFAITVDDFFADLDLLDRS